MKRYRGMLFDLGGTLCEHLSAESGLRNLRWVAARIGVSASDQEIQARLQRIRAELEIAYAERDFYLHRDFVAQSIELFAESYGCTPTNEWVAEYCDLQRDAVVEQLRVRADCLATLSALRARVEYMAIVSNIDDDYLLPLLERTGLGDYFDHVTSSEAAAACKPNPAFFLHALELGGLHESEALFVGDSVPHDVLGALNLGMDVAWLASASAHSLEAFGDAARPTYEIASLADLLPLAAG